MEPLKLEDKRGKVTMYETVNRGKWTAYVVAWYEIRKRGNGNNSATRGRRAILRLGKSGSLRMDMQKW
jgi:hypothetical protein